MNGTEILQNLSKALHDLASALDFYLESEAKVTAMPDEALNEAADVPDKITVTIEQIRAVLAEKSRDGKTAEVRALLQRFGADRLSSVETGRYAELLSAAEVL